jgi:dTDP-4-dehydrorhamnose reductase
VLLVTGAGGQVGRALCTLAATEAVPWRGVDHAALEIADAAAVAACLRDHEPRVVVNCAAWTDVDGAERHPDAAWAANRDGPAVLAAACAGAGIPLLHLSSDHVFDGAGDRPWREDDACAPLGIYGHSKAAGEEAIRTRLDRHLILRTSWVFSARGRNFVTAIVARARAGEALAVVGDQVGGPTPAAALAQALLALARRCLAGEALPWGTYHLAGQPFVSRHALALAIVGAARARGLLAAPPALREIAAADWPGSALRPTNARLDSGRALRALGLVAPDWRAGLAEVLDELAATAGT